VSNVSVRGFRGDELVAALDLMGVRISSGSACSAGTTEPSPVIASMVGRERAEGAIRISLGEATTRSELDRALRALIQVLGGEACGG
jgi:cysteine desulfurase